MSQECPLIAVVDDEEAVRTALRRLFQSAGLAVETFRGGEELLASLRGPRPDCVILDLHMPEMTGFELMRQITNTCAGLPMIAITGHDTADAEESALRNGAAAYLRKPINDRVLLDAISTAIAQARPGMGGDGQASKNPNPGS